MFRPLFFLVNKFSTEILQIIFVCSLNQFALLQWNMVIVRRMSCLTSTEQIRPLVRRSTIVDAEATVIVSKPKNSVSASVDRSEESVSLIEEIL